MANAQRDRSFFLVAQLSGWFLTHLFILDYLKGNSFFGSDIFYLINGGLVLVSFCSQSLSLCPFFCFCSLPSAVRPLFQHLKMPSLKTCCFRFIGWLESNPVCSAVLTNVNADENITGAKKYAGMQAYCVIAAGMKMRVNGCGFRMHCKLFSMHLVSIH